jgi:hypothetical protein
MKYYFYFLDREVGIELRAILDPLGLFLLIPTAIARSGFRKPDRDCSEKNKRFKNKYDAGILGK